MTRDLVCSRSDRLGDLILTLPAVAYLKKSLPNRRVFLHVSEYAADIGRLALGNGVCDGLIWQSADGNWNSEGQNRNDLEPAELLAFFHGPGALSLLRSAKFAYSLAPRTKISTLWTYTKTVAQKRSRVLKSEMEYNVDLAKAFLHERAVSVPAFEGLPKLIVPESWKIPSMEQKTAAIFVNNGASAKNWPMDRYVAEARRLFAEGYKIDFHYSGVDSERALAELKAALRGSTDFQILGPFAQLRDLISYLSQRSFVLASSTGPLHVAHALGVPVFGVYPSEPLVQSYKRWRPCGYWHDAPVEWLEFS